MGVSANPDQLALKLLRAGAGVEKAMRDGLAKSALLVKSAVQAEMHGVTRLRGVGKKGARVGVRYDLRGDRAEVRMTGPAHLLERDTAPHTIEPKKARAIRLADGNVRSVVHHPGTTGKHPFEKGVAASAPLVPRVMAAEQVQSLARHFA